MIISEFDRNNPVLKDQFPDLLRLTWPEEYGDNSAEEVEEMMSLERITVAAVDQDGSVGFIDATPRYGITGWKLHPLAAKSSRRENQIGIRLVNYLEKKVASRGGIMIYLGANDLDHGTALSQVDLYRHTFDKVTSIQSLREHPYEFYERLGYKVVGVLPSANGWDKPDIWMVKTVILRPDSQ